MQLTVHIGTTKTGSSSIQHFLKTNRDRLRQDGILVPASLGEFIHLKGVLASLPFGACPDLARRYKLATVEDHADFRRAAVARYRNEIAGSPDCREVVITAEQLHSRMFKRADIQTFRDLFCTGFSAVRIIVYIRPQLDQIVSLYSTMLRTGYDKPLESFITSRMGAAFRPYFDLQHVISRWTAIFGVENVLVCPYKAMSRNWGTLGDFCDLLGIDPESPKWDQPATVNSSINPAGQELLLILNQGVALSHKLHRKVVHWAELNCSDQSADPGHTRRFRTQLTDGCGWVAQSYLDLQHVILRWHAILRSRNVSLSPYRAKLRDRGTLSGCCDLLGINPESSERSQLETVNISISPAGQELLLMLKQGVALSPKLRQEVARWAELNCSGKGAEPELEQSRRFQAQFADSNDWVVQAYFPDHPEYLEPLWPET